MGEASKEHDRSLPNAQQRWDQIQTKLHQAQQEKKRLNDWKQADPEDRDGRVVANRTIEQRIRAQTDRIHRLQTRRENLKRQLDTRRKLLVGRAVRIQVGLTGWVTDCLNEKIPADRADLKQLFPSVFGGSQHPEEFSVSQRRRRDITLGGIVLAVQSWDWIKEQMDSFLDQSADQDLFTQPLADETTMV